MENNRKGKREQLKENETGINKKVKQHHASSLPVKVSFHPSNSFLFLLFYFYYSKRTRLLYTVLSSWFFSKLILYILTLNSFQSNLILLKFTKRWPPCRFQQPNSPTKLPLPLRWIDWLPFVSDDYKSYPGMTNFVNTVSIKKKRVDAWLMYGGDEEKEDEKRGSNNDTKNNGLVLYFKSSTSHRGQRSRVKLYERLTKKFKFHTVAFDSEDENLNERNLLIDAHAVWSTMIKSPYNFPPESFIVWGTSLGCCSAANLCLYLMRRGTPPAALVLENPISSLPKFISSKLFFWAGDRVVTSIELFVRKYLLNKFDLEKRIRSICVFGLNVPILFISSSSSSYESTSRLADTASALAASQKVLFLRCMNKQEFLSSEDLYLKISQFLKKALDESKINNRNRRYSVDFYNNMESPGLFNEEVTPVPHENSKSPERRRLVEEQAVSDNFAI